MNKLSKNIEYLTNNYIVIPMFADQYCYDWLNILSMNSTFTIDNAFDYC